MRPSETQPNRNQRTRPRVSMVLATTVAAIATLSAYLAMVKFGINVLEMDQLTAYGTAGVFELLLVTIAILAHEAAKDGRPYGVLLVLTWVMSSGSGFFAAWDEIHLGHPWAAAAFRFCVPLLAALGWHLALIGYRHLATGMSWITARRLSRMRRFYEAVEAGFRATDTGSTWRTRIANRRLIRARSRMRRVVPPALMREHTEAWAEANIDLVAMTESARTGHNRLSVALSGEQNGSNQETIEPNRDPGTPDTGENRPATITAPATITVSNVRPLPARDEHDDDPGIPAPATEPINPTPATSKPTAQPITVTSQETEPNPATMTSQATQPTSTQRYCLGCNTPLPAGASPRAKFCTKKKPNGDRDQSCKNRYHANQARQARETFERAIQTGHGPAFA